MNSWPEPTFHVLEWMFGPSPFCKSASERTSKKQCSRNANHISHLTNSRSGNNQGGLKHYQKTIWSNQSSYHKKASEAKIPQGKQKDARSCRGCSRDVLCGVCHPSSRWCHPPDTHKRLRRSNRSDLIACTYEEIMKRYDVSVSQRKTR